MQVKREFPSEECCRWWLKNHVCMPYDWKRIQELYDKEKEKENDKHE